MLAHWFSKCPKAFVLIHPTCRSPPIHMREHLHRFLRSLGSRPSTCCSVLEPFSRTDIIRSSAVRCLGWSRC